MPRANRRSARRGAATGALTLAACLVAGTPGAVAGSAAAGGQGRWKYFESSFVLRMQAAAIEPELDVPDPLAPGVGYSAVNLEKDVGQPTSNCEARGVGVHTGDVFEREAGPAGSGVDYSGGLTNPTEARDTRPNPYPGANLDVRRPQVRDASDGHVILDVPADGNGVRWEARCADETGGEAVATTDAAGAQAAGSTTAGHLDRTTGAYTGQSRAYVAALRTTAGTLDLVSSVMQIRATPKAEPRVSYSIGTSAGTLASGLDVPVGDLARQFNEAVAANAAALAALGPLGVTLLGPTVSEAAPSGRRIVHAPFLELTAGLAAREATLGQNSHTRLVTVDFDGMYAQ